MNNKISNEFLLSLQNFIYDKTLKPKHLDDLEAHLDKQMSDKKDTGAGASGKEDKVVDKSFQKIREHMEKRMTPLAKAYFEELKKTGGSYKKRDARILASVNFLNQMVKGVIKKDKGKSSAVLRLYTRIYDLLLSSSLDKTFQAAFKSYSTGVATSTYGTLSFLEYISLVYTLETMATIITPYIIETEDVVVAGTKFDIGERVEDMILLQYPSLYNVMMMNSLVIVKRYEKTKDPYGTYNKAILAEKKGVKDSNESLTALAIVALVVAGVLIGVPLAICAVRRVIYSFGCLKVDISKSLIDQSYVIAINVKALEEKLSKLDKEKDAKEYTKLEKTIASQKEWVQKMVDAAQWLAEVDSKNLDEIEDLNKNDEDDIEDSTNEEEDGGSSGDDSGKFDI